MCFVDTSPSVDIEASDLDAVGYVCADCGEKFRALGRRVKCPSCQGTNVKRE
ncbi:MAG TPA: hypothetical protein HA257_03415 [Candidatus Methanoperedenaceae archaeon]|nr:hypothetical protein [Candidatus Methanoperedenaceae archaeon]